MRGQWSDFCVFLAACVLADAGLFAFAPKGAANRRFAELTSIDKKGSLATDENQPAFNDLWFASLALKFRHEPYRRFLRARVSRLVWSVDTRCQASVGVGRSYCVGRPSLLRGRHRRLSAPAACPVRSQWGLARGLAGTKGCSMAGRGRRCRGNCRTHIADGGAGTNRSCNSIAIACIGRSCNSTAGVVCFS